MNSRKVVLTILEKFDADPGNLDDMLDREFRSGSVDHRDKRFIFEMVYGIVRYQLGLDFVIRSYFDAQSVRDPVAVLRLLRLGVYQIVHMRVPDYAAVDETVKLAKADHRTKHYAGTVNAILRNVIRNKKHLPLPDRKDLVERLSVEYSHPSWMVRRWVDRVGLVKVKKLLTFNNTKPEIFLRRKLRGLSKQQFEIEFKPLGVAAGGYLNLFYRLTAPVAWDSLALLTEGQCTVQSVSAGWVVALADIRQGEHILDVCSAPGGKAILMAELAGDSGTVCAGDISPRRLVSMQENCTRMGIQTIYPLAADGRSLPVRGLFDKVLVDAPCSGTGVLSRHPEGRWRIQPRDLERMPQLQRELLENAHGHVAAGGALIYATCSIEPEENEAVVESFLQAHPEFVLERPTGVPELYLDLKGYLRITPYDHGLDGMFAARLTKK